MDLELFTKPSENDFFRVRQYIADFPKGINILLISMLKTPVTAIFRKQKVKKESGG